MHIHLDPVGGIAGDMFVGALLDIRPDLGDAAIAAVRAAGLDDAVGLAHLPFSDGILSGSRFAVDVPATGPEHGHVHWSALKTRLSESRSATPVRRRAIDIFSHLAEAEARVHGKAVETVSFHEVGAWDSIADIVAAAFVIESLGPCDWSIGAIPIGSGRVSSAHGLLPVPAPATVLLLEGFNCFDDGFPGERVTPTGAAILRHLDPAYGLGSTPRALKHTGYGFGTRRIQGMSNVLRALQFEPVGSSAVLPDQVMLIQFEVDDQTAEDLAVGLERLRRVDGVLDVSQAPITGKQGRLLTGIQVIARPEMIDPVTGACFHETTTLGLRLQSVDRLVLTRREATSPAGVKVKIADRPEGATAKAELRDVADSGGHRDRHRRRSEAETAVLRGDTDER
jgi:pyridinium-3,5-bisthiocarboxylic acid mononucleotide nickel chelatase